MNDEFYIGYRKIAPPNTGRFIARMAALIVLLVMLAAFTLGALQNPAGDGAYAFGTVESFEGELLARPIPYVAIDDHGNSRIAILVDQGKHGVSAYVRDAINHKVRFDATRIEREGVLMLELAGADHFHVLDEIIRKVHPLITPPSTLVGELVDTKCYLGVMNPAQGKVHRGCAVECLRGGVQPGLLVTDEDGASRLVLISATPGVINPEWAGRTLTVTGSVHKNGALEGITADTIQLHP